MVSEIYVPPLTVASLATIMASLPLIIPIPVIIPADGNLLSYWGYHDQLTNLSFHVKVAYLSTGVYQWLFFLRPPVTCEFSFYILQVILNSPLFSP